MGEWLSDPPHPLHFSINIVHLHIRLLENKSHHDGKVMWTFVSLEFLGADVLIRRQELAPKFFMDSLGRGQVDREAGRIPEAFKATIKFVICHNCSNTGHVQIMKLVSWIQTLFRTLLQNVWFCKNNTTRTFKTFSCGLRNIWQSSYSITATKGLELKSNF